MLERGKMKVKDIKEIVKDLPDDMELWVLDSDGEVNNIIEIHECNVSQDIEDLGGTPTKEDDFPYLLIETEATV